MPDKGGRGGETYPLGCFRGLRKSEWVQGDRASGDAFTPDGVADPESWRPGSGEVSVNWDDDADTLGFTRDQRSDRGFSLNQHGVARLTVEDIESCRQTLRLFELLWYERKPLASNRYHGNLLFQKELPKQFKRAIAGALGLASKIVPARGP